MIALLRQPLLAGPERAVGWALLLLALAAPGHAASQEVPPYARQVVAQRPHGAAVAVALRLPAGSGADPEGLEGTAWIAAAALQDQVNRALGTRAAVFSASVERGSTVFALLADPAGWRAAWALADSVLFTALLDPTAVQRHRDALIGRLAFEAGSPVRAFEAEAADLVAGPGSPFGRPPRGTRTSLPVVSTATLEAFRSRAWRRDAAALALVGPPSALEGTAAAETAQPADVAGGADPAGGAAPGAGRAWTEGERRARVQDVTNAWIVVAYPVPPSVPRTELEMLAHLVGEELDPVPPAAERYSAGARVEDTPAGAVLVVEASVFPEAADLWEGRILRLVERLGAEAMGEDFFTWRRRRFRASRLLDEAAPEVEAARKTADLLREGRVRDLATEIWGVDARALRDAAAALGAPRILVIGPDLRQGGGARD